MVRGRSIQLIPEVGTRYLESVLGGGGGGRDGEVEGGKQGTILLSPPPEHESTSVFLIVPHLAEQQMCHNSVAPSNPSLLNNVAYTYYPAGVTNGTLWDHDSRTG